MKSLTVHEFRNGLVASSLPNSAGCKHQHHDVFAMTSAVAGHITLKVLIRVRASKEQRGALPDGHLQLHRMPVGIVRASESKCGAGRRRTWNQFKIDVDYDGHSSPSRKPGTEPRRALS
jgi:hypothetical protein